MSSSVVPPDLVLYHISPRSRRDSITRDGLRRMTWQGHHLVLCLADEAALPWLIRHIGARHGVTPAECDIYQVIVPAHLVSRWSETIYVCVTDITPPNLRRMPHGFDLRTKGV